MLKAMKESTQKLLSVVLMSCVFWWTPFPSAGSEVEGGLAVVSFYSFPYNAEGKDNLVVIYTPLSPNRSQVERAEENAHLWDRILYEDNSSASGSYL